MRATKAYISSIEEIQSEYKILEELGCRTLCCRRGGPESC